MDHDTFRTTFSRMGFEIEEERNGEDEPVLIAENRQGDKVWWSVDPDTGGWGLYVQPDGPTFDDAMFSPGDVEFSDDALVIPEARGTRPAEVGYGRRGFDGEVRIDSQGVTITEVSEHRA